MGERNRIKEGQHREYEADDKGTRWRQRGMESTRDRNDPTDGGGMSTPRSHKMNRLHLQTWIRKKNRSDYPKLRRLKLKDHQCFLKHTKADATWQRWHDEGWRRKGSSVIPLLDVSRLTINMKGQSGHSGHMKVLSKNLFQHRMWRDILKEEICSVMCRISTLPARLWCVLKVIWLMQFWARGLDFGPSSGCWHKEHRRLDVKTGFTKTHILKIHLRLTAIVGTDTLNTLIDRFSDCALKILFCCTEADFVPFIFGSKINPIYTANQVQSWNSSGSLWHCQKW